MAHVFQRLSRESAGWGVWRAARGSERFSRRMAGEGCLRRSQFRCWSVPTSSKFLRNGWGIAIPHPFSRQRIHGGRLLALHVAGSLAGSERPFPNDHPPLLSPAPESGPERMPCEVRQTPAKLSCCEQVSSLGYEGSSRTAVNPIALVTGGGFVSSRIAERIALMASSCSSRRFVSFCSSSSSFVIAPGLKTAAHVASRRHARRTRSFRWHADY